MQTNITSATITLSGWEAVRFRHDPKVEIAVRTIATELSKELGKAVTVRSDMFGTMAVLRASPVHAVNGRIE